VKGPWRKGMCVFTFPNEKNGSSPGSRYLSHPPISQNSEKPRGPGKSHQGEKVDLVRKIILGNRKDASLWNEGPMRKRTRQRKNSRHGHSKQTKGRIGKGEPGRDGGRLGGEVWRKRRELRKGKTRNKITT